MRTLAADLRYAFRMMRSNPAFTAVAVAALALGIGANTAIFTVVNAVLLRPLPYPQPERIMKLGRKFINGTGYSNSIPKYNVLRRNDVFEVLAIYGDSGPAANLGSGDRPNEVKTAHVSKEFFQVFGVAPFMGRTFNDAEDLPNGPQAAVIGYNLWQTRLGGDRQIIGSSILINKQPYTVVGVLPKGFQPEPAGVEIWTPQQTDPNSVNQGHYLAVAGRLKPGVTLEEARAEMKVVGERFRAANPTWMDKGESVAVMPMREAMVGDTRTELLVLEGAVMFVLLIACANVANLLLARAAARHRELSIRAAIGASRGRMLRQLLTESVLLAAIGGTLGFALGAWGVGALLTLVPGDIPRLTSDGVIETPPLDWSVAAFTAGVALLTGILFGLFPALHTSNPDLASTLKEGGRTGTGKRQNRIRASLVISEVALSLVLLIGAALLIRTFVGLRSVSPGLDPRNVLTLQTSMAGGAYATTAKADSFCTQVIQRLEALPGVQAASASILLPMENDVDLPFNIAGKPPEKGGRYNGDQQWRNITQDYFKVFRVPLLRGREFNAADTGSAARVVIINQAMAKQYWPKQDPIGQVIIIGKGLGPQFEDPPRVIVGVVASVRETGLSDSEVGVMYIPQSQTPQGMTELANSVIPLSWEIRTAADPLAMRAAVEREFRAVDNVMPLSRIRSLEQVIAKSLDRNNFEMLLLSLFAGIALLLASIGIYGLMSYSVEQRTQEIGIRMALGARQRDMLQLVVWQGVKLAVIGVALGLAASYGLTRVLGSMLFGVKASDPLTFGGVAAALLTVAALAAYIPARHAAAVEPSQALRQQ
jgi:putative ABC transport system permease protein